MTEDNDYKCYARYFNESWQELETRFRKGEVNPQQENDVVCFLYYAFAKRLEKKSRCESKEWLSLNIIRTEDSILLKNQRCRVDINLNDRLFIEVKIWELRKFTKEHLKKKHDAIKYYMTLLEKYNQYSKKKSLDLGKRKPILAIWFWKKNGTTKLT